MKNAFIIVLSLLIFTQSVSRANAKDIITGTISSLTVGAVLDDAEDTAAGVIAKGKEAGNDLLISTGNMLLSTIRFMEEAFADSLDKTFSEIDEQQQKAIHDLKDLLGSPDVETLIEDSAIQLGPIARSFFGSDRTPIVISYDTPPIINKGKTEVYIQGLSLERGSIQFSSPTLIIDKNSHTATSLLLAVGLKNDTPTSSWDTTHEINITIRFKKSWYSLFNTTVEYKAHVRALDLSNIEVQAFFNSDLTKLIPHGGLLYKEKHQENTSATFSHDIVAIPPRGFFILPGSYKKVDYWERRKCSNDYTGYTVLQNDLNGIRVRLVGKEEGGAGKYCGAFMKYSYKLAKPTAENRVLTSAVKKSDSAGTFEFTKPAGQNVVFSHFELKEASGEITVISDLTNPKSFFEIVRNRTGATIGLSAIN